MNFAPGRIDLAATLKINVNLEIHLKIYLNYATVFRIFEKRKIISEAKK